MNRHVQWIARTVLVSRQHNNPEASFQTLERILSSEGHHKDWKINRYYEKRWMKRRRLVYENCKQIYNTEMQRKIGFVLKGRHASPWRVD